MKSDTIAAVATAPGTGAISVIRISGNDAFDVAEKIFSKPIKNFKTHTAHYGNILSADGSILDSVLLLIMKAPKSYTGEDSIEISCHGGQLVTKKVLRRIFESGARPAEPGEFSLRAFLNGKLDLAQAEAVQELIAAKSELALENAERQLEGSLSEKISQFQKKLTEIAAILEAWVDFPEEGLEFASMEEILSKLESTLLQMQKLQSTFHDGKILHEGLSLCLIGSPNVGKSSLMNALLGKERAIVTEIPGTTRDLLEEDLRLGQLYFKLIDTAGIRDTDEIIEKEGIRRSQIAMKQADVVILLLDASRGWSREDEALFETTPKEKTLVVWNKIDLTITPTQKGEIAISAKKKIGIEELKQAIDRMVWKQGTPSKEEVFITQFRHFQALSDAIFAVCSVINGLKTGISAEFVTSDMRASLHALRTIIGVDVTEEILSEIFRRFCLGK